MSDTIEDEKKVDWLLGMQVVEVHPGQYEITVPRRAPIDRLRDSLGCERSLLYPLVLAPLACVALVLAAVLVLR